MAHLLSGHVNATSLSLFKNDGYGFFQKIVNSLGPIPWIGGFEPCRGRLQQRWTGGYRYDELWRIRGHSTSHYLRTDIHSGDDSSWTLRRPYAQDTWDRYQ